MSVTARRGHWSYVNTCGWWLEGTNIVIDRQPEGGYELMTDPGGAAIDLYLDTNMAEIEANIAEFVARTQGRKCNNCGQVHGDAAKAESDGSAWWHGDAAAMPEVAST
jgi:hypothetical protein